MLLPPGIKNEGNICFASCVLHSLLNQEEFCMQHLQQGCSECQQGLYIIDKVTDKHCLFVELPRGLPPCIIATICCMKQNYFYQAMTKVLPSSDLIALIPCKRKSYLLVVLQLILYYFIQISVNLSSQELKKMHKHFYFIFRIFNK